MTPMHPHDMPQDLGPDRLPYRCRERLPEWAEAEYKKGCSVHEVRISDPDGVDHIDLLVTTDDEQHGTWSVWLDVSFIEVGVDPSAAVWSKISKSVANDLDAWDHPEETYA